jgi:colanic acid/amylovoran biosynthesis glycosyltransferase
MTLTIIGDSSGTLGEECEKEKILSMVRQYNLENSIDFLGFQPHQRFLNELYNHHIFISPSITAQNGDSEGGSPVAITEASAAGLPILSTWHCDISEVVLHKKTGFLTDEKNSESLGKKIIYWVNNPQEMLDMGMHGRRHIEKEYNIKNQIGVLHDIYKKVKK